MNSAEITNLFFYGRIPVDMEFQAIRTDHVSRIPFGGGYVNIFSGSASYETPAFDVEIYTSGTMYGPQGGAQLSLKSFSFALSPFFMARNIRGKTNTTTKVFAGGPSTDTESSAKIPAYTVLSYSFDIVSITLNLSLSSILQVNPSAGDNNGYKPYIFYLVYEIQFMPSDAKSEETVKKKLRSNGMS